MTLFLSCAINRCVSAELSRRKFLSLLGVGLLSEVCGGAAYQSPASPDKTPGQTVEQEAKSRGLAIWKGLLSGTQDSESSRSHPSKSQLKMQIINPDVWASISQQVLKEDKSTAPLKVAWSVTDVIEDPRYGIAGTRFLGVSEFTEISIGASGRMDTTNNIWSGQAEVDFKSRSQADFVSVTDWQKDKTSFLDWISKTTPEKSFSNFSLFKPDSWYTDYVLKNGQWQRLRHEDPKAGVLTRDFDLPTSALEFCDTSKGCVIGNPPQFK